MAGHLRASLPGAVRRGLSLSGIAALGLVVATHSAGAVSPADPAISVADQSSLSTAACSSRSGVTSAPIGSCSSVNLFGGAPLAPGQSHVTTIVVRNTGRTAWRSLALSAGTCASTRGTSGTARTASGASLCDALRLRITTQSQDGTLATPVRSLPLAHLHDQPVLLPAPAQPGASETVRFTVTLSRDVSPALMGGAVSQQISWQATG